MISIKSSKNLEKLPPHMSVKINWFKKEVYGKKSYVANLDIWSPVSPAPYFVIDRFCNALKHNNTNKYPQLKKIPEFREIITEQTIGRLGLTIRI